MHCSCKSNVAAAESHSFLGVVDPHCPGMLKLFWWLHPEGLILI